MKAFRPSMKIATNRTTIEEIVASKETKLPLSTRIGVASIGANRIHNVETGQETTSKVVGKTSRISEGI